MPNDNIKITASALRGHPDLMTVKDIQSILNVGRSKSYELVKNGTIRSIKIGAEYRIPKTFLLDYLNAHVS